MITLKGMTWDHTRGYDPMVATAAQYARNHPGVNILWEERSLQAFADFPIEELAAAYDLIVIDHPHVGIAARAGCLVALDALHESGRTWDAELQILAEQSVGPSHFTYQYAGRQWALAIDAATQVAAYRPDLLTQIPTRWSHVIDLARQGRVIWPIKPVDALMSFFTLAANTGNSPPPSRKQAGDELLSRKQGLVILEALSELAQLVSPECLAMNPIEAYERMVADDRFIYCPLGYGYTNYSREAYRPRLLRFTDIPALGNNGPIGSCIGGTGIAISAHSAHRDTAIDYAFWIASAECQRTLYFDAGGQPGNRVAWEDDRTNRLAHGFFRDTRATLDGACVRPRYPGYLDFQDQGGTVVNAFLAGKIPAINALDALQRLFVETQTGKTEPRSSGSDPLLKGI